MILGLFIGLPTPDPTWAAGILMLLNPKLLPFKYFLQRGQGGAVYVSNMSMGLRGRKNRENVEKSEKKAKMKDFSVHF